MLSVTMKCTNSCYIDYDVDYARVNIYSNVQNFISIFMSSYSSIKQYHKQGNTIIEKT